MNKKGCLRTTFFCMKKLKGSQIMNENIPLDGTNIDEVTTDKDAMSLLIMRQAFIDATRDTDKEDIQTDEITDNYIKEEE